LLEGLGEADAELLANVLAELGDFPVAMPTIEREGCLAPRPGFQQELPDAARAGIRFDPVPGSSSSSTPSRKLLSGGYSDCEYSALGPRSAPMSCWRGDSMAMIVRITTG
jgi:hypothetical protein